VTPLRRAALAALAVLLVVLAPAGAAAALAAPPRARPGAAAPCYIPKRMHHTPAEWTRYALKLLRRGRTADRQVFVKVYEYAQAVGGREVTATLVAVYVFRCRKWMVAVFREGRFVTNFFPGSPRADAPKTFRYIRSVLARAGKYTVLRVGVGLRAFASAAYGRLSTPIILPPVCRAIDPSESPTELMLYVSLCSAPAGRGPKS